MALRIKTDISFPAYYHGDQGEGYIPQKEDTLVISFNGHSTYTLQGEYGIFQYDIHLMNIHKTNMPRHSSPLTLEYILLGILAQKPMHGYELHKELASLEGISLIWSIKQSQLYALLDKLETQGLLSSALVPGEAHPPRKEFHLTLEGKQSLKAWIENPVQHGREMRQDFLARLYFASQGGKEKARQLISDQASVCSGWLQELEEQVSRLDESHKYEALVYQFRISQTLAMLDWLAFCARKFTG